MIIKKEDFYMKKKIALLLTAALMASVPVAVMAEAE